LNQGSKSNTYPLEIPFLLISLQTYQPTPTSVIHLLRKPDLQMGCWFWLWTLQICRWVVDFGCEHCRSADGLLILAVNIADPFKWWSTCCVASSNFCCNTQSGTGFTKDGFCFVKNPARTVSLQLRRIKAPKGSVWKHYTHSSVQKKLHQEDF
jgi:hypothetical protein